MKYWIRSLAAGLALAVAGQQACATEAANPPTREEFAALKSEVEALRGLLPTQAHTMVDVEHQFANLWFAARERNWPLAQFYLNETRGRVAWTMRIRPVRKLANGEDIVLAPMAKALEDSGFAPLKVAVENKDHKAFEAAYRAALSSCHACHVAIEKPALKPEIPRLPGALLIRMKPERD